jgi:dTDP-4-dehydrorhamnose 3,5-epimerase
VIFQPTPIAGAYLIQTERIEDERGSFTRTYCRRELEEHGLDPAVAQCNLSTNRRCGTLRGLHFQVAPHTEAKLLRVLRGAIFDAFVDLRPDSPSYLKSFAVELTAESGLELYLPRGLAHGFQTLADDTEVFYQLSDFFTPAAARGYRYDDPAFGILWPLPVSVISERDRAQPFFDAAAPPELSL